MNDLLPVIKACLRSAGLLKDAEFCKDLAGLTTTGTGGKCLCFIPVYSKNKLINLVKEFNKNDVRFIVIGDGSNILFGDGMHQIVVLKLGGELSYIEFIRGNLVKAGAGYNLQKFMVKSAKKGFDFSFLGGIPGTIGGAVMGNSGTAVQGINEYLESIDYLPEGDEKIMEKHMKIEDSDIQYRTLNIDNISVITGITVSTDKAHNQDIFQAIRNRIKQKKKKQPLNKKNAGCFFKNPGNNSLTAGELIDSCNLKGFSYGGARISEKHANFIDNFAGASSKDIYVLSKIVRDTVKKKYGLDLEYEVDLVGLSD